jgi:hypothetical protein
MSEPAAVQVRLANARYNLLTSNFTDAKARPRVSICSPDDDVIWSEA